MFNGRRDAISVARVKCIKMAECFRVINFNLLNSLKGTTIQIYNISKRISDIVNFYDKSN